jgi:hypothetical protein
LYVGFDSCKLGDMGVALQTNQIIALEGALILGVLGIWLAYLYRQTVYRKFLAIGYAPVKPITSRSPTVPHLAAELKGPVRALVLLWNRGELPIERSDFAAPVAVKGGAEILAVKIAEKDMPVIASIDEQRTIHIDLLQSGQALILQIDIASPDCRPDLSVALKRPHRVQVMKRLPGGLSRFLVTTLTIVVWFGAAFEGTMILGALFPNYFSAAPRWLLDAVLAAFLFGSSPLMKALKRVWNRLLGANITPVALRFFFAPEQVRERSA